MKILTMDNVFKIYLPAFIAVVYFSVGTYYAVNKNWPWAIVWTSYAAANVGLVWAAYNSS